MPTAVAARWLRSTWVPTVFHPSREKASGYRCRWPRRNPPSTPGPSIGGCGSGSCLRAAEPCVQPDAAETRLAQRQERALLDPAARVSGLSVAHDLTRVADGLQVAGDDFVERCSFRAGNLDDTVSWCCKRHIGNAGSNIVRRDGLEQTGR